MVYEREREELALLVRSYGFGKRTSSTARTVIMLLGYSMETCVFRFSCSVKSI